MPPRRRLPIARLVFGVGGLLTVLVGGAAIAVGRAAPAWLHRQLPQLVIDASAVGGAAVALGVAAALIGVGQLVLLVTLDRGRPWLDAAASVAAAVLAALLAALAVALLTEVARGAPGWLLLAAIGILAVASAYGAAAIGLARAPA